MSTISCTPAIGLANTVENQVAQSVNTFSAAEAMPARSKSMLVMLERIFTGLIADIGRSRALAHQAFPSIRGN